MPEFDPFFGGSAARALVLMEAPGPRAFEDRGGSGFVSPDNDDRTAARLWHLVTESGLRREHTVFWNVVPWYLGSDTRIAAARAGDVIDAQPELTALVAALPDLRVVLTLGEHARRGWLRSLLEPDARLIPTLAGPHPSPVALAGRPERLEDLRRAFDRLTAEVR